MYVRGVAQCRCHCSSPKEPFEKPAQTYENTLIFFVIPTILGWRERKVIFFPVMWDIHSFLLFRRRLSIPDQGGRR